MYIYICIYFIFIYLYMHIHIYIYLCMYIYAYINIFDTHIYSQVAVHCKAPTFFWHLNFFGVFPRFWPIFFEILFLQRLPCVFQRPKQFETLQKYFWGTPHGDSTHLYALISRFFKKNMGFVVKRGMILNTARIWKQGLKRTVEPPKTQQCKNLPTGIPNIELRAAAAGLKRGDGR